MKKLGYIFTICLLIISFAGAANAQSLVTDSNVDLTVVMDGLHNPKGLFFSKTGKLYVADTGSSNLLEVNTKDGTIYSLDTHTNIVETILTGLPSVFVQPTMSMHGVTDVYVDEKKGDLYVTIGPVYNLSAIENIGPTNFNPVKFFTEFYNVQGFSLLKYDLNNANSTYDKVVNFLDQELIHDPNGSMPDEVESNPFRIDFYEGDDEGHGHKKTLFVIDSGNDSLWKINKNRTVEPFVLFGKIPGTGINTVPAGMKIYKDNIYVSYFTGFPFIPGMSKIVKADMQGNIENFVENLTLAIGLEFDREGNLFILEYADSFSMNSGFNKNSGRLLKVSAYDGTISTIVSGINFPTDITFDKGKKNIFITAREKDAGAFDLDSGIVYQLNLF